MKDNSISQALKSWRKRRKLKQREAAILLNVALDTFRKWEQAASTPTPIVQDYIRSIIK